MPLGVSRSLAWVERSHGRGHAVSPRARPDDGIPRVRRRVASCGTRRSCARPLRRQDVHRSRRGRRLRAGGRLWHDRRARPASGRWLAGRTRLCGVLARRAARAGARPDPPRGRRARCCFTPRSRPPSSAAPGRQSPAPDPHDGRRRMGGGRPSGRARARRDDRRRGAVPLSRRSTPVRRQQPAGLRRECRDAAPATRSRVPGGRRR